MKIIGLVVELSQIILWTHSKRLRVLLLIVVLALLKAAPQALASDAGREKKLSPWYTLGTLGNN